MMRKIFILVSVLLFSIQCAYSQTGWFSLNSGIAYDLRGLFFINENTGWIVGFSSNVMKTTNGGNNWIIQSAVSTGGYICVYFINEQTGWIGGGHGSNGIGIICKTTNGGTNWYQIFYGNTGIVYNAHFLNLNTGWFPCDFGNVLKTTDGGATFTIKNVAPYNWNGIYFINENTGWVAGESGKIFKSTDGGINWAEQVNSSANLSDIWMFNQNTGFIVGLNGTLLTTTNGGNNWIVKTLGNTYRLNDIFFLNNSLGYLCGGVYHGTVPCIMVTTNGGINWFDQSVPVNNWIGRVYFLNQNTGYAVGQGGKIVKTTTGGFNIPAAPVLISPANNSVNISPTPTLMWNSSAGATQYKVQISTVPIFSIISDSATVTSTNYIVPSGKLSPGYTYYWRVNASNVYGISLWSSVWMFSTSVLPSAPTLLSPPNGTLGTSLTPTLLWNSMPGILNYHVQISTVPDFAIITDSSTGTTNQYTIPAGKLSLNITYFWKVCARNSYGWDPYSAVWYFIPMTSGVNLISTEIPGKFMLYPNYPNPFNPETIIAFDIAQNTYVRIIVYDISGKTVAYIINQKMNPGKYSFNFSGNKLSTGIYFLRFDTQYYSAINRLILIK